MNPQKIEEMIWKIKFPHKLILDLLSTDYLSLSNIGLNIDSRRKAIKNSFQNVGFNGKSWSEYIQDEVSEVTNMTQNIFRSFGHYVQNFDKEDNKVIKTYQFEIKPNSKHYNFRWYKKDSKTILVDLCLKYFKEFPTLREERKSFEKIANYVEELSISGLIFYLADIKNAWWCLRMNKVDIDKYGYGVNYRGTTYLGHALQDEDVEFLADIKTYLETLEAKCLTIVYETINRLFKQDTKIIMQCFEDIYLLLDKVYECKHSYIMKEHIQQYAIGNDDNEHIEELSNIYSFDSHRGVNLADIVSIMRPKYSENFELNFLRMVCSSYTDQTSNQYALSTLIEKLEKIKKLAIFRTKSASDMLEWLLEFKTYQGEQTYIDIRRHVTTRMGMPIFIRSLLGLFSSYQTNFFTLRHAFRTMQTDYEPYIFIKEESLQPFFMMKLEHYDFLINYHDKQVTSEKEFFEEKPTEEKSVEKKYFFETVQAQADDPIYQNQQIVIMTGMPSPQKPPILDEDYKNDPSWMEDKKRFKTPSEEMLETTEKYGHLLD